MSKNIVLSKEDLSRLCSLIQYRVRRGEVITTIGIVYPQTATESGPSFLFVIGDSIRTATSGEPTIGVTVL